MKTTALYALIGALLAATASGQGTILWNESVNGPLSNLPGVAFSLGTLGVGTNSVLGSAEAIPNGVGGWGANDDYFLIAVPSGLQVAAVQYSVDRSSWAWIGDGSFSNQYGFMINPSNGNLLPQWNLSFLSSGIYGLYISDSDLQTFPTAANYRLDFVVQAIPEPASLWLLVGGLGCLGIQRWRKSV